jgi:choline dehydrogenase
MPGFQAPSQRTLRYAGAVAIGLSTAYIIAKLLRELGHALFPSIIPGETNTALLASPLTKRATGTTTSAKDLENVTEYDYIIVGGGTAGCVLANRLTEDPKIRVLMIESGHSDLKQIFSRIPAGSGRLYRVPATDWNLKTEEETECDGRRITWPRGKMLYVAQSGIDLWSTLGLFS